MLLHTWFPWMDVLLYDRKLNPYTHKDWDTSTVPAGWMVVIILTSWLTSGRLDARDAKAQDKYTNFFSTMKSHVNQIEYIYICMHCWKHIIVIIMICFHLVHLQNFSSTNHVFPCLQPMSSGPAFGRRRWILALKKASCNSWTKKQDNKP